MKRVFILVLLSFSYIIALRAQITNSSYLTKYGERVLQLSVIIPLDINETWKLFTTSEGWMKWAAPVAKVEMKTGGIILTNYNKNKLPEDSTSIRLDIINYLENNMLTLKVNLNSNFPEKTRKEDRNLQEILQFVPLEPGKTKVISSMVGWGKGTEWDQVYNFFEKGNTWTYGEVLKLFAGKSSNQ